MRSFSGTKDQDVVDEDKDIGDMAEQAGQALLENFRCTYVGVGSNPTSDTTCCVLECNVWRSDPDTQQRATWTFSKNDLFQLKLIHMRYKSFTLLGWLAKRATGSDSDTAA